MCKSLNLSNFRGASKVQESTGSTSSKENLRKSFHYPPNSRIRGLSDVSDENQNGNYFYHYFASL